MNPALRSRFALACYRFGFDCILPPLLLLAAPWFLSRGKRRRTFLKRLGIQPYPSFSKDSPKPLWVHCLSVGELLSGIPLINALRSALPDRPLVVTVSTLYAFQLASERLREVVHGIFYFPYDFTWSVRRCIEKIRPALFVLVETDIWPGFLLEMRRQGIPCLLVNGRLSPGTFRFSRILRVLFQPVYETFHRIYPQSDGEAQRFLALGIAPMKIGRTGNLKYDGPIEEPDPKTLLARRLSFGMLGCDRVLVAGSTHPGEESILRSVFLSLKKDFPGLCLVLAPRNPRRALQVAGLFERDPLTVSLLSQATQAADVTVVDRLGVLGETYALADFAFVGGSLVRRGGQNPIEPAAAAKPVLFGADMSDFPDIARQLLAVGGAAQVRDEAELTARLLELLQHPDRAVAMGKSARALVEMNRGVSRFIAVEISRFMNVTEPC